MANFDTGKSPREIYLKSHYNHDKVKHEVVDTYLYGFLCCTAYTSLLNLRVLFPLLPECSPANEIIISLTCSYTTIVFVLKYILSYYFKTAHLFI